MISQSFTFLLLLQTTFTYASLCPLQLPTPLDPLTRIHGGLIAPPLPYIAALFRHSTYQCTASSISSTILITAAHCVPPTDSIASQYHVRIGTNSITSGQKLSISSFTRHPEYNIGMEYDVALIHLSTPIQNSYILPISSNPLLPSLYTYVRLVAFGATSFYKPSDGKLRRADILTTTCSKLPREVDQTILACAGGRARKQCVSCKGDSGAPWLAYDFNNRPVIVGVHVGGTACGNYKSVSVFVRAAVVTTWLEDAGIRFKNAPSVKELKPMSL